VEVDSSVPAVSDQENRNGAVATRVFEEIFNQGRFDVANEIYAPEFRNHGLRRDIGLEKDQNAVHREKQAFPDLKMTIDLLLPKGEFVTVVWTFRGTHTGPGIGLPPTGATIALRGIAVWRIENGRILEEWTSFNELPPYLQVARHVKWFLAGGRRWGPYRRHRSRTPVIEPRPVCLAPLPSISRRMNFNRLDSIIRVHDAAGNVMETHEHAGDFKEW
jgi:steroid delta-isomerase-like uncharacterized protein